MSVEIEVLIKYPDQDEPTIYRDADVLKRCPSIDDTLKKTFPDWATEGIKLQTPMVMLWSKDTMEFCFNHAHRYALPESPEEPDLEEYKEANEKTLDELKQIAMCAYDLEYSDSFCKALDFVIGKKLPKESRDEFYGFYSDDDESVEIEVLFKYSDQDEPTIYRDADVLKRIQLIDETLERTFPNWATEGIKLKQPMMMLWSKDTMEFCFNHAHRYTLPESPEEPDLEEYKEANEKTLDKLKAIAACATAMECSDSFCEALKFVIAEKLKGLPKEKINKFSGIYSAVENMEDRSNTRWFWITVFSILFVLVVIICVEFCFNHAHRYTLPESPEERDLEEYKEANENTLNELKNIAVCASALEYSDSFCKALKFVIVQKLKELPQEKIDELFGIDPAVKNMEDRSNTSWFWITVLSILFVLVVIIVKQFS